MELTMQEHPHAVIWIDHHEARIIRFDREGSDEAVIHPDLPHHHLHVKAGTRGGTRATEDQGFYHEVATAVADARSVFVAGPANAKTEFVKHIDRHDPELAKRVAGVEPMDHVTDGDLLAAARRFLKRADRM
jgi:stalled ribosome rescue protein Dom34